MRRNEQYKLVSIYMYTVNFVLINTCNYNNSYHIIIVVCNNYDITVTIYMTL